MSATAHNIIKGAFESALADLVACYTGVAPQIVAESPHDVNQPVAAIIGFGDSRLRGSAVLLAEESVAKDLAETTPLDPIDWLGELCNQLVGRLKNKLAIYGILPQMGTPVTVCGRELDLGAVGMEPIAWRVTWSKGHLQAMLTLEVEAELELVQDVSAASAAEGSLNLF